MFSSDLHLRKGAPLAENRALEVIWDSLGAGDRGIRHAGRVALEKQPVKGWKSSALAEVNPRIATAALIALARADGKNSAAEVIDRAISFDYAGLKQKQDRLDLLRVLTLALTRGSEPTPGAKRKLIAYLDKIYPATSPEENRESSVMMAHLHAPSAVSKLTALMENASGQDDPST